jgi:hypothetical protein
MVRNYSEKDGVCKEVDRTDNERRDVIAAICSEKEQVAQRLVRLVVTINGDWETTISNRIRPLLLKMTNISVHLL